MSPDSATLVAVRGAHKRYGAVRALDDVDFTVRQGEVRALLGKNGAGKSTLIRAIAGAEQLDAGTVTVRGTAISGPSPRAVAALGVATVYQELSLVPSLSVADNLMLGQPWPRRVGVIDQAAVNRHARAALERLEVDVDPRALVGDLTVAEQQLVEIARALDRAPAVLVLDEPTSSLAVTEVRAVLDIVRRVAAEGVAVIYVSHRMDEIRQIADQATVMRDGKVVENLPVADSSTSTIIELMLGSTSTSTSTSSTTVPRPSTTLSEGRRIALTVENLVRAPKLSGVSFALHDGEVLGIAGLLGSGRTELLRCIAGMDAPDSGRIVLDGVDCTGLPRPAMLSRGVAMTPENRKVEGIFPELGLDTNMLVSNWSPVTTAGLIHAPRVRSIARRLMDAMAVTAASPSSPITRLSGGNQQKAVLGRWLHAKARVLLLDEPTRGIDVEAKRQIYGLIRALAAQGHAIVFVSGELEELPAVCDRIVVLCDGVLTSELAGDTQPDRLVAAALGG
jgi:simple sugar transport system ATP-binding protein